jgi:hypothetical protein
MVSSGSRAILRPTPTIRTTASRDDQLRVSLARTPEQIWAAWCLVYASYHRKKLIDANRHQIHFVPQSVQEQSAVVIGRRDGELTTTLSLYEDDELGLPLDAVYKEQLDALRQDGCRLYEVGMLADRCDTPNYRPTELFEIMRFPFHYGAWANCTDMVIGVHPHHAAFYERMFGFDVAGPQLTYGLVRDNPVVLLKLDLCAAQAMQRLPRGIGYFLENPVPHREFDMRFRFHADTIYQSMNDCIESFKNCVDGREFAHRLEVA